ncbi:MAG: ArgE/DapE family deacylase [Gemmatimonadetes bacterium]|nr:ArgE/DapE family deacylase [Gemmatimonadota bacterium]
MPPIDHDFTVRTLARLVQINSVNPGLSAKGQGESEIASFVIETLERLGLDVSVHEPEPGRVSVVGVLRGRGGGKSLMLNAHYDTVGVEGMPEPFSGTVRNGKLYGRGAYDMKGSLAAQIGAAKALVDAGVRLAGDLLIAAVADEEVASIGTADLVSRYRVDGAIVTEPTALKICLAHKGFVWLEVETQGRAAHGSKFELGIDANMRMGRVLAELERLERDVRSRKPHPLVGPPSLHAATLQGGTGLSTYAASCRLGIERRTVPGESERQVVGEIQDIVNRLSKADGGFAATVKTLLAREPFEVKPEAGIVRSLAAASTNVLGQQPPFVGDTPWMDSALLSAAGVETVVMGPAGAGAHAAEEWVDIESAMKLAEILADTAVRYCGEEGRGAPLSGAKGNKEE